jgi:hypothetical protein
MTDDNCIQIYQSPDGEINEKSNLQKMQIARSDKPVILYTWIRNLKTRKESHGQPNQ